MQPTENCDTVATTSLVLRNMIRPMNMLFILVPSPSHAPGLKTGFALLPSELVEPICNLKGNHDFGSSNLAQHILCRLIESGAYTQHVQTLRNVYRIKCEAMLNALRQEFLDWPDVTWTNPAGGLYVWVRFPEELDAGPNGTIVPKALQEGVLYVPGEFGHVPDAHGTIPRNEARLSFGVSSPDQIAEGIRRLRAACRGLETARIAKKQFANT